MSWGKRWTIEQLQAHQAGKAATPALVAAKKITPDLTALAVQSESAKNERRKFRDHKPNKKHKFCESFMEDQP